MKKIILSVFVIAAMMTSCSDNGKKAETSDAAKVEQVETDKTVVLKTVKEGSNIEWRASHLGGAEPRFGKVFMKEASAKVNNGELTNATAVIDMSSLTVENFPEGAEQIAKLTGHLLSPDLFNVEKYPTSIFELSKVEKGTGEYNSVVTGNLTILGVTKSITFNANVMVSDAEVTLKSEDFAVDRNDWGLSYHVEGSEGVPVDYLIANDMGFTIDLTLTK